MTELTRQSARSGTGPWLLPWCAPDEAAAVLVRRKLAARLASLDPTGLPAAAAELVDQFGGGDMVRGAVVAMDGEEAARALGGPLPPIRKGPPRPVALLFPGHGAQHHGMATGLYARHPVFAADMDRFLAGYGDGGALRDDWLSSRPRVPIDEGQRGQPLLFGIGMALGRLVRSWGVPPSAVLGHSIGELVAAAMAGVLDPAEGPLLMSARSTTYGLVPAGRLLAVATAVDQAIRYATDGVHVAVVNGPRQVVLGGLTEPMRCAERVLRRDGYTTRPVRIPQPFHTPLAVPAADAFEAALRAVHLHPPTIPLYSAARGGRVSAELTRSPRFWARQMSDPVLFWAALDAMLTRMDAVLVEAGPGHFLTALARRHRAVATGESAVVSMSPARPGSPGGELGAVLTAAAALWAEGHDLDWSAVMPALSST